MQTQLLYTSFASLRRTSEAAPRGSVSRLLASAELFLDGLEAKKHHAVRYRPRRRSVSVGLSPGAGVSPWVRRPSNREEVVPKGSRRSTTHKVLVWSADTSCSSRAQHCLKIVALLGQLDRATMARFST